MSQSILFLKILWLPLALPFYRKIFYSKQLVITCNTIGRSHIHNSNELQIVINFYNIYVHKILGDVEVQIRRKIQSLLFFTFYYQYLMTQFHMLWDLPSFHQSQCPPPVILAMGCSWN